ncbi:MAG TPA: glycosyltransferase family 2 protein [Chitinophagaceae bacterium]|nr:glycosyltransferase family 2 protein [Chitinophagaceae bacterium]
MDNNILISVVIPVKDGAPWLHECLQAIMNQTLIDQTEIIVIDSGSTDGTLDILKNYNAKVHSINPKDFNHGLTRNYAVQFCKGEYIVMTVQDARATDNKWLQNLMDGFAVADNVAGVCGQQVVPHDKDNNPVSWHRPYSEPSMEIYHFNSTEEFDRLSPLQKKNCCGWDDVTAMYRKTVLEQIPFQKITYGEDAVWAQEALRAGYSIVYNNAAKVYHYHNEDWNFSFKRAFTTMYLRYKQFKYIYPKPRKTLKEHLSIIKTVWKSHPFKLKENLYWISYNNQQYKAAKEAYSVFMNALAKGDDELDAAHKKYCGIPPSPLKKTYSVA